MAKLSDILIVNIASREVVLVRPNIPIPSRSFDHLVEYWIDEVNEQHRVRTAPAGTYKKGDILPEGV